MTIDPADINRLRANAVQHLAIGAIPLGQWANVFANPELFGFPSLRCKAFVVWFGTVLDFLRGWPALPCFHSDARSCPKKPQRLSTMFPVASRTNAVSPSLFHTAEPLHQ